MLVQIAEGLAGILTFAGAFYWISIPVALFIGTIGVISVFKAVYIDKRELRCACVGGDSRVPLGAISPTETDLLRTFIMSKETAVVIFKEQTIRRVWHNDEWWFAVVDVVAVLTDSANPADYFKKMRSRDKELGKGWGQIVTPLFNKNRRMMKY